MTVRELLEKHHEEAWNWARHCCHFDKEVAGDALQTAYLKVLEGKAVYRGKSAFKTWLFSVIRFTAIDCLKEQNGYPELGEAEQPGYELQLADESTAEGAHYEHLLARLPQKQRETLLLVFYHGLTLEEAAAVMEISIGTVRTHYDRGKKKLREMITTSGIRKAI